MMCWFFCELVFFVGFDVVCYVLVYVWLIIFELNSMVCLFKFEVCFFSKIVMIGVYDVFFEVLRNC